VGHGAVLLMQATSIQTSYNGGEISPRMQGRVDQAIYSISSAEMLNFVPTIEGPAMKRSGFRYIRGAAATAQWLSSFIFSVTQAYVLEWSDHALRFYTNGGRIESGPTSPYELGVPFLAAEAPVVSQQQSYDRLYLAHGSYPPGSLLRTAATTFSYAALTLKNGPFADRNTNEAITVTASATTGSVTITAAGGAPFLAGHVGGNFMVEAMGFSEIKAWEPQAKADGGQLAVNDLRRSDGKVYQCVAIAGVRTGSIQPTHTRGAEWDGSGQSILGYDAQTAGVQWLYLYDSFGVGTITAIGGGGTTATVTVTRRLADSLTASAPSFRWYLPAISDASGWPKQVLLAFGRLIFFTDFEIIASVVGDYGGGTVNMAPFTDSGLFTPDMAFRRRLDISNPILWVKKDRDVILVGTADGTHAIRKINSGQTFSSDNVECVPQGDFGVSPVPPVKTGVSTIFVQSGGRKLREAGYDLQNDRYVAPNINIWQRHILKTGAVQLAFQGEPDELLWAVRGDGQMALHPHVPEQEVRGFARIAHGDGPVLSACAIPGAAGSDELWALVLGSNGRSVQLQDPSWEDGETLIEDAFFVDSGATYNGAPTTTVTGLTHLAGQPVAVLADGAVVAGRSVTSGGALTPALTSAASKIHVGRPFTARLTWLRPEVRDAQGNTVQGKIKRLVDLVLRLIDTGSVKVDPGDGNKVDELVDRPTGAPMSDPVPLFNGDTTKPIGGSWRPHGQATIISDEPLPCMVVASMPRFDMSER
jgi:hypothetical protein